MMGKRVDQSSSSDPTSGKVDSPGMLATLRGVPRWLWLLLSALVLTAGSIGWWWTSPQWGNPHTVDASEFQWWNRPWMAGADSALPEISARLFAIGVQPKDDDRPARVWIAGARGFLAYSEDNGQCWTLHNYTNGEFVPGDPSCKPAQASIDLRWPELVPTALAAVPEPLPQNAVGGQKSGGAQQARPTGDQQQAPLPNSPPAKNEPVDNGPADRSAGSVTVSPLNHDFGNVALESSNPRTKEFRLSNQSRASVSISIDKPIGDANNEFSIASDCKDYAPPNSTCPIRVTFSPKVAGPKKVEIVVQVSGSQVRVSRFHMSISASVRSQPLATTAPPAPPMNAPDLLAIRFEQVDGEILATGGTTWRLQPSATWKMQPQRAGTVQYFNNVTWRMHGASTGSWATETRITEPLKLLLAKEPFGCDCTMRSQVSDDANGVMWAAGWTKEPNGAQEEHAVVFRSVDKGSLWIPVTRGALQPDRRAAAGSGHVWIWPPLWYWGVLGLSGLLAAIALVRPADVKSSDSEEAQTGNIEGRLSSDKPLGPGDIDVLGLTSIALGLSRFLRNKNTLPPLTIAVNGPWGSGKSSLMNLLRCDLQSYGMRPVWFNAWHHQKEEHLLAALLQTVRLEAVPPLWNLLGIPFRARLLWYRVHRRWPLIVLFAAVALFLMVLDWHLRKANTDLILWALGQLFPSATAGSKPLSSLPIQGGFLTLLATAGALWKGLSAFGTNPATLLASVAKGNKLSDLDAQTSFRQKFAVEFRDVTNALGSKRPLVIFVDDLDRCRPENVREVLEAVNFLVTSGDCFVVLGIDREQVQRAIGLSFKEVAEESPLRNAEQASTAAGNENREGSDPRELARAKRAEFAQKYLEKLINLEVRVPVAADDDTKRRLFERKDQKEPLREKRLRLVVDFSKRAVPAALATLLLFGAFQLSKMSIPAVKSLIDTFPLQAAATPAKTGDEAAQTPVTSDPAKDSASRAEASPPVRSPADLGVVVSDVGAPDPSIKPARPTWPARWVLSIPLYLIAVFLLLAAQVVLTTRPGVQTTDSAEFKDALEKAWYAFILAKQNTPRAAKRFVNRVRYLAMRQRTYKDLAPWWDRAIFPQRLREPERKQDWKPIPEPLLVAMAAIEQMEGRWIYEESAFEHIVEEQFEELGKKFPSSDAMAVTLLGKARAEHKKAFPDDVVARRSMNWASLPEYHGTFVVIWPKTDLSEAS